MPITPFHLGPGAALKGVLGRHMSFTSFALANGLIDLEPVANFLIYGDPMHRFLHTLIGATLVALVTVWPGRRACEWALRIWNARLSPSQARYLAVESRISIAAAVAGAALGAYTHVFLDSIMHVDVQALAPFMTSNPIQGWLSIEALHLACALAGAAGLAALGLPRALRMWRLARVDGAR